MSICPSNPVPKPTCQKCPQEGQCQCGVDLDTVGPKCSDPTLLTSGDACSNQKCWSG